MTPESQNTCILIVEDNEEMQDALRAALQAAGYDVVAAYSAGECDEKIGSANAALVLLDVMLPDANGLVLIERIRKVTDVPILAISGKKEMEDKVIGLEMGADDYIAKPFEMPELHARIRAHIRRYISLKEGPANANGAEEEAVRVGRWTLDRKRFQIFDADGKSGHLTVGEFRLLELLASSPNRVMSRERILEATKDESLDISDRSIDIQVARIRKKIGDDARAPGIIRTVRSVGYMFVQEG